MEENIANSNQNVSQPISQNNQSNNLINVESKSDLFYKSLLKSGLYMFFLGLLLMPFLAVYHIGKTQSFDSKLTIDGWILLGIIAIGLIFIIIYTFRSTYKNIKYLLGRK